MNRAAKAFFARHKSDEVSGCDGDVAALWWTLMEIAPQSAMSGAGAILVMLEPQDCDSA